MNKCPNNRCGERHSYVPKGTTSYVCEWCHQVRPDPEVEFLRARVAELEKGIREALKFRSNVEGILRRALTGETPEATPFSS